MDAFEKLVAEILWTEGYWVRTSVHVNLTKPEKVQIGRPSSPRWELDVVGYRGRDNVLQVIECKSYLDSRGVTAAALSADDAADSRFKLFVNETLRTIVLRRLVADLAETGACPPDADVRLGLAFGRIASETVARRLRLCLQIAGGSSWMIIGYGKICTAWPNVGMRMRCQQLWRNCYCARLNDLPSPAHQSSR